MSFKSVLLIEPSNVKFSRRGFSFYDSSSSSSFSSLLSLLFLDFVCTWSFKGS